MTKSQNIVSMLTISALAIFFCNGCDLRKGFLHDMLQQDESKASAETTNTNETSATSKPAEPEKEIRGTVTSVPTRTREEPRPDGAIESAVLIVNRDHITGDEVLRRIRPELESMAATFNRDVYRQRATGVISQATRDLVSETLLYQEISARIDEDQNPVIDKAVEKDVTRLANQEAGGSLVRLDKMLMDEGASLDILRQQLRRQIVTQQYLKDRMKPKVIVTRDEMWDYYQEHLSDFSQPEQVCLHVIEIDAEKFLPDGVTWDTADKDQKRAAESRVTIQMKEACEKLKNGEDFALVARLYSSGSTGKLGGGLGWISRGSYRLKAVEDKAFSMKPGEISDPVKIGTKTYILKVSQRKPAKYVSFSEAQAEVKGLLEQQVYRRLVMEHLGKLWDRSQIGSLEPFIRAVYSRLPTYEAMREKSLGKNARLKNIGD